MDHIISDKERSCTDYASIAGCRTNSAAAVAASAAAAAAVAVSSCLVTEAKTSVTKRQNQICCQLGLSRKRV